MEFALPEVRVVFVTFKVVGSSLINPGVGVWVPWFVLFLAVGVVLQ